MCLEFFCVLGNIFGCIDGVLGCHMSDLRLFVRWWTITFAFVNLSQEIAFWNAEAIGLPCHGYLAASFLATYERGSSRADVELCT